MQEKMSKQNELFPSLGDVASRTDALPEGQEGDDKPEERGDMAEIESMCMRCHDNVNIACIGLHVW